MHLYSTQINKFLLCGKITKNSNFSETTENKTTTYLLDKSLNKEKLFFWLYHFELNIDLFPGLEEKSLQFKVLLNVLPTNLNGNLLWVKKAM